jgi:mRNA interferase HigB
MRVIAKRILREFWEKHRDAEQPLKTWYKKASHGDWNNPMEVKAIFSSASILKNSRVVFNICRHKYRLVVDINYQKKLVFIRFMGTHADYDAIDADNV